MKMFTSIAVGVFGLATLGQAHMKMTSPTPYSVPSIDNSPLNADGSNFPCKQASGASYSAAATNTMPIGSVQTLSFIGSAVHGGGSCQVSVTYDAQPNAKSTFKVIHSIIGGCPMKNITGNNGDDATEVDPDQYPFTIPSSLPTGSATLAWTWFNHVGNREMYMNCAPIMITAGSSKRSDEEELMARNITQLMERDQAAFNSLPDMFVANIPTTECTTTEGTDLLFPNLGDSVDYFGAPGATNAAPVGPSCQAKAAAATGAASQATTAPPVASTASPVATTASPAATTASAVSGGVFQTVTTTASAAGATTASAVSVPVASTAAGSGTAPSATSAAPAASTGTTGSGTAVTAGTACTSEGMFNCVGGTSYQQCASGTWSVIMPLAAGTSCTLGQSMDMIIAKLKRSIRFSEAHIRRQLQSS